MNKILVTGGAGYLGSVLCRKLLNRGYKVKVLDNLTYGDDGIKGLNIELLKGDIRNIHDIVEAVHDVDAVIHLAAIVGDPACAAEPVKTLEVNYLATKAIIEACKWFKVKRFIFASTCSIYGKGLEAKLTEKSPLNPVSLYAESKIKCEEFLLEATDENFSPTILRMAGLYGYSPNMRFDLVINLLTGKIMFDKKISVFGGEQWRPWISLDDVSEVYLKCLETPKVKGEIFNVLSENYKIIEIGRIVNSIYPEAKLEINKKITDQRDYNVSFDKISKALNFQPKQKVIDGVVEIKNAIEKGLIKDYKDPKYRIKQG